MKYRAYRVWILLLVIVITTGVLPSPIVAFASSIPFDQGSAYERGGYDQDAVQPTLFNWTRQSRFTGSSDHDLKWSFETGDAIYSTPAIGADGTIYVGSYDGKLYALHAKTGELKWSFETGFAIASSPAIGADGTIFIGSGDRKLYALDPDATEDIERVRWTFETEDRIYSSPVIGGDGTIYITSYDGKLYALDPEATDELQREKWSYELGGEVDSTPAIGGDGIIYVGSGDGFFYALDPSAINDMDRLKWSVELNMEFDGLCWDEPCPIYSSPTIGADGTIYVGSYDGNVYALDPHADNEEERVKWSFDTWSSVLSSPAIGADGVIYVGATFALDPDADEEERVKWSLDTVESIWGANVSSPVIGADGTVYIGSYNKKLYALDANATGTNRLKWTFTAGGAIHSSPVIGSDGTIYIGAYDGKLYALGTVPHDIPTSVIAVEGESAINLRWDSVDGAAGYNVYQYAGIAAPTSLQEWELTNHDEWIIETEYTINNLAAGQLYWFAVKSVDIEGSESEFSEYVSMTPYTNITEMDNLTLFQVATGTELDDVTLPNVVNARLTDNSSLDIPIVWDVANSDYDPSQTGDYKFTGELQLSAHIRNPNNFPVELIVRVLPDNAAKLRQIMLNGEPLQSFAPGIYTYIIQYPYATEQVTITAETDHPTTVYEVEGGQLQSLHVGYNEIYIHVMTEDHTTSAIYTIVVERKQNEAAPMWPVGSQLNIADVTPTSVKLTWPAIENNDTVIGYRLYVNDEKQVDLVSSSYEYDISENVYMHTLTGLTPNTSYRFNVKAYDAVGNLSVPGLSQTGMTLSLPYYGGWYVSNNTNLQTLEIWTDQQEQIELTPVLTTETLSYTAKTDANRIKVKAVPEHAAARVTWEEQLLRDELSLDLQIGKNVISLVVQGEDGSLKNYTILIERLADSKIEAEEDPILLTDIAGHWAEKAIQFAIAQKIVNGYSDHTFQPDKPITRAEFTVMLASAWKLEQVSVDPKFTDDDEIGSWAKQAIAQSVEAGIVTGYEDGSFRPNRQITRAEMAVMIARTLQLQMNGKNTTVFTDHAQIPSWAVGAVEAVSKLGIIAGRGANHFVPNKPATRAESVVLLIRMLEHRD